MYLSDRRQQLREPNDSKNVAALHSERVLRAILMVGFLLVLSIEGWLLFRVLTS